MNDSRPTLTAIEIDESVEQLVELHWILTRRCQYSCWYCPPHRHDPRASHATEADLLEAQGRVLRFLGDVPVRISLTGGEPTMHPGMPSFVASALETAAVRAVRVVSNLAGPLSTFQRLAGIHEQTPGLEVVASFHTERARVVPFLDRVRTLSAVGVPVLIKTLEGEEVDDETARLLDELRQSDLPDHVELMAQAIRQTISAESARRLSPDRGAPRWGDARVAHWSDGSETPLSAEALIRARENHFRGWTCDVGSRSLFVDSDGSLHAALCKPHGRPLANVFNTDIELQVARSVVCPHHTCGCAATVRIPKRSPALSSDS